MKLLILCCLAIEHLDYLFEGITIFELPNIYYIILKKKVKQNLVYSRTQIVFFLFFISHYSFVISSDSIPYLSINSSISFVLRINIISINSPV